ncbi:MAG: V-type ATP synthase subunit F [Candidatus Auribacterota bacterium]|jgi:V/A-type H+-transporting ATPase subunit F|nr:V-type ATP synthase subunit F [Candidatus Auribacterota bacterium]
MTDFFVIGDEYMVLGFGLVGIPGVEIDSSERLLDELNKAVKQSYRIIMVSDRFTGPIQKELEEIIVKMDFPLVIEIPDRFGAREGKKSMKEILKSSLGFSV